MIELSFYCAACGRFAGRAGGGNCHGTRPIYRDDDDELGQIRPSCYVPPAAPAPDAAGKEK